MRPTSVSPNGRAGHVTGDNAAAEDRRREPPPAGSKVDRWIWPAAAGSAELMVLVLAADLGSPWRPIVALVFMAIGPGASLVPLIGLQDLAMELMLVVPLSFALVALSSAALFYAGVWSPTAELAILLGLCVVGLTLQYAASRRVPSRAR
jgi:hypothetical protein